MNILGKVNSSAIPWLRGKHDDPWDRTVWYFHLNEVSSFVVFASLLCPLPLSPG